MQKNRTFASVAPRPSLLALGVILPASAFAAEATPGAAPAPAPAPVSPVAEAAAPAADSKPAAALKPVQVTGQAESPYKGESETFKRPVALKDTPQSSTVITRQVLKDRNANSLKEAVRNAPSLTLNAGEGGGSNPHSGDNFSMRGFSTQSDIFQDNIRDTSMYTRDLFATEQVEIIRGASAVYQGRGSAGGSINLTSKVARAGNAGEASVAASTANSLRAEIDVNRELSGDFAPAPEHGKAAVRVVAMGQRGGSPRNSEITDDRTGVSPSVTFGLGTDTTVSLTHSHYEQQSDGDYGIPYSPVFGTPGGVAPVDYSNWYGIKGQSKDNTVADITTLTVESKLDDRNTLRNTTRYNTNERDLLIYRPRTITLATGTITLDPTARLQGVDTLTNQTDLVSKFRTGEVAHTLNVGAELQQEKSSARTVAATGALPVVNLYNPNAYTTPTQTFAFNGARTAITADTYAAYLNETLHATRWLDLIGGLRFDHVDAVRRTHAASPATTVTLAERQDNLLSWRAGAVLKPSETVSVYGTVANTKQPSFNNLALNNTALNLADVDPEETNLYEVGAKWEAVKGRLLLGAAYFVADKYNLRETINGAGDQALTGRAVSQGVELSAAGSVTKRWNVLAAVAFTDSEVKESFTPAAVGRDLVNTPEWTASLWNTLEVGRGWSTGLGLRYVGERYVDPANTGELDDFIVADFFLAKQLNAYCRVQLNVDNIADVNYIEAARAPGNAAQGSWATPGYGRLISGSVRFSF